MIQTDQSRRLRGTLLDRHEQEDRYDGKCEKSLEAHQHHITAIDSARQMSAKRKRFEAS
jgi:hypothetical protein